MATSITFTRAGFVAGTVYAAGDVATVSDTDATIAISSRIARYTTDPAPVTGEAEVLIALTANMTTEQKAAFRANIGATDEAGTGEGDVDSAAPVLAGAVVTTANAMGALAIDVTKSLNTKTITGAVTLTLSATPAVSDTRSILRLYNNSATASVVTLPGSPAWYSENLQANITTITLPAYWRGEISWCYDGTRLLVKADPVTGAQVWVAQTVATNAVAASAIDWALSPSHSKTLAANTTFTFSNATDGQAINVAVTNTASNYTVAWPTVQWAGGAAPTQTVGAKTDIYTFIKVGSTIYGTVSANHS